MLVRMRTAATLIQVGCKIVQLLWKTVLWFLTKPNMLLTHDLAVICFGIYPKVLKTYVLKTFHRDVLIALFILPKLGSNQDVLQKMNR